jgi:AraC-like DNA-binding protein
MGILRFNSFAMASTSYTLSAGSINLILHLAQQKGANREDLCQRAGIDVQSLSDPDARFPTRYVQALWKAAVEQTGENTLPLQMGEMVNLFSLGVLAYLLMNCPTVEVVIEKVIQYQDIACAGVRNTLEKDGATCRLKTHIMDPDLVIAYFALESELSVYVSIFAQLTGLPIPIEEVHFAYSSDRDRSEYRRVFRTDKIFFESDFTGIVFPASYLPTPVLNANVSLFHLFEKHARDYLGRITGTDTLGFRVRQAIIEGLKGEEPKLSTIARELAMSERSIQMKLKEEGLTYQQLLDEVRKEIALSHLREPHLSTTDIAYLLGFSELSVFSRAFKKWTGTTPNTYRKAG